LPQVFACNVGEVVESILEIEQEQAKGATREVTKVISRRCTNGRRGEASKTGISWRIGLRGLYW